MVSRSTGSILGSGFVSAMLLLALPAHAETTDEPLSADQSRAMSTAQIKESVASTLGQARTDLTKHRESAAESTLANAETSLLNAQMADRYDDLALFNAVKNARSDVLEGKTAGAEQELQRAQQQIAS